MYFDLLPSVHRHHLSFTVSILDAAKNANMLCGRGISTVDNANISMTVVGVIIAIIVVMYSR